jgi:hypothetical protein
MLLLGIIFREVLAMYILNLKILIKVFFINLLSLSMITSSMASTSSTRDSAKQLQWIAETINTNKLGPAEIIAKFQSFNPKKGQELEAFFAAHPDYRTIKIPKATVEDGKLSFLIEGKKVLFLIDKNEAMEVFANEKKIRLEFAMTFEETMKKISEILDEKKVSFFSFFIEDSQAGLLALAGTAIIATGLTAVGVHALTELYLKTNFKDDVLTGQRGCKGIPFEQVFTDVQKYITLRDLHDRLFDDDIAICVPVEKKEINFLPTGYDKEACAAVHEVRLCLREKVEELKKKFTPKEAREAGLGSSEEAINDGQRSDDQKRRASNEREDQALTHTDKNDTTEK